jgi:hypothetical protein
LDSTEARLHPDAGGVVGVGQHQTSGAKVIEALEKHLVLGYFIKMTFCLMTQTVFI